MTSTKTCPITYENNVSSITILSLDRHDSGKYTIEAKNNIGVATAEVILNVIDVPSKPEGPMIIKDLKKDSLTITWKPSLDDGGLEIVKYCIEKCDPQNGVWMKVADVQRDIDSFCIQKLLNNSSYIFRVIASNPIGASEALESDTITIKRHVGTYLLHYSTLKKK